MSLQYDDHVLRLGSSELRFRTASREGRRGAWLIVSIGGRKVFSTELDGHMLMRIAQEAGSAQLRLTCPVSAEELIENPERVGDVPVHLCRLMMNELSGIYMGQQRYDRLTPEAYNQLFTMLIKQGQGSCSR